MRLLFSFILLVLTGCGSSEKLKQTPKVLPTNLAEAVESQFRTADNKARDQYRHPVQTLEFFGVKPNMTVVEISPSRGWYTQILAPYLAQSGKYYAATTPSEVNEYFKKSNDAFNDWVKSHPELEGKVTVTQFSPPTLIEVAPAESADMVLTFRNVHNWMAAGSQDAAFKAFYKALKPGGILGVVEHRANDRNKQDPKAKSGYVSEKHVIALAKKAGFKFVAKSEINANSKDTKDYPDGVWTLPPALRLGEKDRARYQDIGESDRMTLKFVKPTK